MPGHERLPAMNRLCFLFLVAIGVGFMLPDQAKIERSVTIDARPEVLEEVARVSRGKVIEANKLEDVLKTLAELPDPPPSVRRVQLWSHPALAAGLVALMGVFWVGRKLTGLI